MYLLTTAAVVALLVLFMFSGKFKVLVGSLLVIAVLIALIEFGIGLVVFAVSTESGKTGLVILTVIVLAIAVLYFMLDIAVSIIYFMLDEEARKRFGTIVPWKAFGKEVKTDSRKAR